VSLRVGTPIRIGHDAEALVAALGS
jgi:hypothetical protein